jgi:hypothetical protein
VVKEHHSKIAPVVIPQSAEAVEEKIILPLVSKETGVSYELDARIDLTDINGVIRDNKALGRSPNQNDVDRDLQLSTYALAKRLQTKKAETGLALDIIVKNKTPKAVTIPTARTREHLQLHLNTTGHIAKAIQAEAFPRNPTGWWCSKKFCGYYGLCMGRGIPEQVDIGQNLRKTLNESISQVRSEREHQSIVPKRSIDGGHSEATGNEQGRGTVAPSRDDPPQQGQSNDASRPERALPDNAGQRQS